MPDICLSVLMSDIYKKVKQGFKISNTPEFFSLISLCSSDVQTERLSACKCVFYLWKWKYVDTSVTLNLLRTLACQSKNIDGIMFVFFNIMSNSCEEKEKDKTALKNDLVLFHRSTSNIISSNASASLVILSLFNQLEMDFVIKYYKPILIDILFGAHPHRSLVWPKVAERVNQGLFRNFIFSLKLNKIEDSILLFDSVKLLDISNTERCLYLTVIIRSMLVFGYDPQEALKLLKSCSSNATVYIQTLVFFTLIFAIESYSEILMHSVFNLCEWFIKKAALWTEILWMIVPYLLSLLTKSSVYPDYYQRSKELIDSVIKRYQSESYIDLEFTEEKSVIFKYVVRRYDCLHQPTLVMRLLEEFKENESSLVQWLNKLSNNLPIYNFKIIQTLLGKYFLTRGPKVRLLCLSIFEKWNVDNLYLYLYQLKREDEPILVQEILKILSKKPISKNKPVVQDLLNFISQTKHKNSYNITVNLLKLSCENGLKLFDDLSIILNDKSYFLDSLSQAVLAKTVSSTTDIYFEELISYSNAMINNARKNGGNTVTALTVDIISCMCEKRVLDVSILWNDLFGIIAGDLHPSVHQSVCHFLGKIPLLMNRKQEANHILYKSARVLWYFANHTSMDQKLALRCLREYELDMFDITFVSEECRGHLKYDPDTSILMPIKGNCWLHLIKDLSFVELFLHLIDKCKSKARFRGNYSSLFDGIVNFLATKKSDKQDIIKCLKILSADWTNIPIGNDLSFLNFYLTHTSNEIRELALSAVLKFSASNDSARLLLGTFIEKKNFSERDKAIMCLLPGYLLHRDREINEYILFDGLQFGLQSSFIDTLTGEALNFKLEKAIIYFSSNSSPFQKRMLMKILLTLWTKINIHHEVFKHTTKLITIMYGHPFIQAMPFTVFEGDMCIKYIHLNTELAIYTKSLRCFDISVGFRFTSVQKEVIENLLYVLRNIGNENRRNNIKWILRVLCMCTMKGSDYLGQILVYGMNFLSGVNVFSSTDTLKDSLDNFPLAINTISDVTGKRKNITATLSDLVQKKQIFHPVFIEAFRLSLMRLSDEPCNSNENSTLKS